MSIAHNGSKDKENHKGYEGKKTLLDVLLDLSGFEVTDLTRTDTSVRIAGYIRNTRQYDDSKQEEVLCPLCGSKSHTNGYTAVNIKHLPLGRELILLQVLRKRYLCPHCHHNYQETIPFKSTHHFISKQLQRWIEDLLTMGITTIKGISRITGVHSSIIKDIDKHRLKQKYYTGKKLGKAVCCYKKPTHYSRFLGIDEFSLHKHHQYATTIMDLETGEILYVAYGKQKQVVYDFIKLFGDKFMRHVVAVASDMNAGYQAAFKEKYSHIESVYDHFHLVKNFNEGVITKIRNEEYQRLLNEHKPEEAKLLKNSKYLLLTNPSKLDAKGEDKLKQIFASNKLLYAAEIVKEIISHAYALKDPMEMEIVMSAAVNLCLETNNSHFVWFAKLIQNHLDGIIMYTKYSITTGKVEGTNNKIKTIRRQAYGFRDDEYFFLKILDFTNKSHRKMK